MNKKGKFLKKETSRIKFLFFRLTNFVHQLIFLRCNEWLPRYLQIQTYFTYQSFEGVLDKLNNCNHQNKNLEDGTAKLIDPLNLVSLSKKLLILCGLLVVNFIYLFIKAYQRINSGCLSFQSCAATKRHHNLLQLICFS